MEEVKMKKKKPKIDKGDLIFYCIFMAWPVLQFCVYYIGVNINSILMSFQYHTVVGEGANQMLHIEYFSLKQYEKVFLEWLSGDLFKGLISVSLSSFFITTLIGLPLGLLFAFYIFKKLPFWSGFRVILFLPSILSGIVVAAMFRYFLMTCVPNLFPSVGNLLDRDRGLYFPVLMFYNVWIGFGTSVLMYSNKMSGIADEIIESAHLDGATGIKEFWYIVLPLTYSTISVFMITGVAGICINQYGVYDMFAWEGAGFPEIRNLGYWFFMEVSSKFKELTESTELPYYSAIGVVLTFVTVPVALGVRWALEHFGPTEE